MQSRLGCGRSRERQTRRGRLLVPPTMTRAGGGRDASLAAVASAVPPKDGKGGQGKGRRRRRSRPPLGRRWRRRRKRGREKWAGIGRAGVKQRRTTVSLLSVRARARLRLLLLLLRLRWPCRPSRPCGPASGAGRRAGQGSAPHPSGAYAAVTAKRGLRKSRRRRTPLTTYLMPRFSLSSPAEATAANRPSVSPLLSTAVAPDQSSDPYPLSNILPSCRPCRCLLSHSR